MRPNMSESRSPSIVHVFRDRKMAYLLLFGFSSGMPLYLTSQTLGAWLTTEQIDLTTIGLFSLVGLPYSLKFLWSPLLDRYTLPLLGRRRGWIALCQLCLVGALVAMAVSDPGTSTTPIAVAALAVAFFSASQDIVVDAYRTDVLAPREMGAGAAVNVLGYRIALWVTGSAALALADLIDWQTVYLLMACCMAPGLVASIRGPEPSDPGTPPRSLNDAVRLPFGEFIGRLGWTEAGVTLAFIALYKLGDNVVTNMTSPFLIGEGFSLTDIAFVRFTMGLGMTIVGVFAGGAYLSRVGIWNALWIFGWFQAGTNILYFVLAQAGGNYPLMVVTINLEYFTQGLGTAALVAFLMSLCNRSFSATQYALLSSFIAFNRDIASAPAGAVAEATGWPGFFLLSVLLAMPGMGLLWWIRGRKTGPGTSHGDGL
jgi:PAT family beta-lactamase induction signal transducer AmpG